MPTQCGIDEAGRGPIIGPIVMCGVLVDEQDIPKLQTLGVKDSKLLSPLQREKLVNGIEDIAKAIKTIIIQPIEVDAAVDSDDLNLNWLEAIKSVEIINSFKPDTAIIDCPSNNVKAYSSYLRDRVELKKITLIAEHKADVNYPSVSAASIIAKVTRDTEIEALKKHVGIDFGSGYMADERTARFLTSHWNKHPEIFRHSWEPYKKIVQSTRQQKLIP